MAARRRRLWPGRPRLPRSWPRSSMASSLPIPGSSIRTSGSSPERHRRGVRARRRRPRPRLRRGPRSLPGGLVLDRGRRPGLTVRRVQRRLGRPRRRAVVGRSRCCGRAVLREIGRDGVAARSARRRLGQHPGGSGAGPSGARAGLRARALGRLLPVCPPSAQSGTALNQLNARIARALQTDDHHGAPRARSSMAASRSGRARQPPHDARTRSTPSSNPRSAWDATSPVRALAVGLRRRRRAGTSPVRDCGRLTDVDEYWLCILESCRCSWIVTTGSI